MPKPLKSHGNDNGLRATNIGFRPGDFPLGSPESRAVARAMLESERELSDYDRDCLLIHSLTYYPSPSSRDMQQTEVGKRGREVREIVYGPVIPAHEDPVYRAWTQGNYTDCSEAFCLYHGIRRKFPKHGDILHYEEVTAIFSPEVVERRIEQAREAWARRLPELPCPVKFEDGKVWYWIRLDERKPKDQIWVELDGQVDWQIWAEIEAEARGERYPTLPEEPRPPAIDAVIFREDDRGKSYVEPLRAPHN